MPIRIEGWDPKLKALEHLRKVGIIGSEDLSIWTMGILDDALSALTEAVDNASEGDKPTSMTEAFALVPEYAEVLDRARIDGAINKKSLQDRGILRGQKAKKQTSGCAKGDSVRAATVDELTQVWDARGLPAIAHREWDRVFLLPPGVREINIDKQTEVREEYFVRIYPGGGAEGLMRVLTEKAEADSSAAIQRRSFAFYELIRRSGVISAELISDTCWESERVIQFKVSFSASLRAETLLYALFRAGVFSDEDLKPGSAWRERTMGSLSAGKSYASITRRDGEYA